MYGQGLFFATASLLGVIYAYTHSILALAIFLVYFIYLYQWKKWPGKRLLIVATLFVLFFVVMKLYMTSNRTHYGGTEKNFEVLFTEEVKVDGNRLTGTAKTATGEKLVVSYRLSSEQEKHLFSDKLIVGQECLVTGTLKEVKGATNVNAFDYKRYLLNKKVHWQLSVEKWNSCHQERGLILTLKKLRHDAIRLIDGQYPGELSAIANAMLFGERFYIDVTVSDAYQKLGIVHLLAISGFNIGLFIGMLYFLGVRIGLTKEKTTMLLLLFLPILVVFSGWSPSVIRAALMTGIILGQKFLRGFNVSGIDALSMVFICYVLIFPFDILDVGFQLSFIVTLGLLLSKPILSPLEGQPFRLLVASSVISQITSLPFLLYYYYEFSLLSILTNLLYIPLYSFIILPLLIFSFVSAMLSPPLVELISSLVSPVISLLNRFTTFLAEIPFQTLTLGRPSYIFMWAYAIGVIYTLWCWQQGLINKARSYLLVLLCLIQAALSWISVSGEVTFIDVGQGDSTFIRHGVMQNTYLIDTGGTVTFATEDWEKRKDPFEVGKDVVVPFLKSKGVRTLDKLIITHGDMDHAGGAFAVLEAIRVKELVLPNGFGITNLEEELVSLATKKNVQVVYVQKGMKWEYAKIRFDVLNPTNESIDEPNDRSIVLYTKLGGKRFLFTGDLEESGESKLIHEFQALPVDVLKVGHHGSNTSTTELFLQHIQPKVAIISVGLDNRFGHPTKEVLSRLEHKEIKVLRTDQNGAITYFFRGNQGTFSRRIP